MTPSTYAVRRRLIESTCREFAIGLRFKYGIPTSVTIEGLLLLDGDEDKFLSIIDYLAFDRTTVENTPKCAALLEHARRARRGLRL